MIFQDPFASLNPAHTVRDIISRAITLHNPQLGVQEVYQRVYDLMTLVGLTPPEDFMPKHPSQLSGGQRQRIVIARALAVEPEIIVADEPTSMLDVSIGIDIMNLLLDLRERKKLTMMYITHNLAGARYVADDIVIMYAGNAVEYGDIDEVIAESSLHGAAAFQHARAVPRGEAEHPRGGGSAESAREAEGLPVLRSLPKMHGSLPQRGAGQLPGQRKNGQMFPV